MEIYQLRTLTMVAREQHLTRAAELLHLSQPAVSSQIKNLEQEFGVALFERRHGHIQLTKAGSALMVQVQKVLAAAEELANGARLLSGKTIGKLALGIILNPEFVRLGALTTQLLEQHPLLDVDIRQRNSTTVLSSIRSHELDASFYLGNDVPPDIESIGIRPVGYRICGGPGWKDKLDAAGWNELAEMPWIKTPREGSFFQMIDGLFRGHGLQLRTVIEADHESAIVNLVRSGVGLSLIREEVIAQAPADWQLTAWKDERTVSTLRVVFLRNRCDDPLIKTVQSALNMVWADTMGRQSARAA